jgi:hypothetical protein
LEFHQMSTLIVICPTLTLNVYLDHLITNFAFKGKSLRLSEGFCKLLCTRILPIIPCVL